MNKNQFYKILFLVSYWILAVIFITTYEASSLGFKSSVDQIKAGMKYDFGFTLISSVLFTIIIGAVIAAFEVLYFNNILRKKPFGFTLIVKTIFYLINIFVWTSIGTIINYSVSMNKSLFHNQVLEYFFDYLTGSHLLMTMIFWSIAVFSSLFILQVSDKFGQGVLVNFLLGKYHQPKEEERIFMFMDLKSSTTYAEKLGHIKYSRLIQDCFFDVNELVDKYDAQIYQYVGDEVVLTWEMNKGVNKSNCINIFFEYDNLFNRKREYYYNKYGMLPEFKAGLNSGFVTVAEVGELKKELAYHGDVLNTAARIQAKCNHFQKQLLISETLKNSLEDQDKFTFDFVDNVKLKGKEISINIYDVKCED